MIDKGTGLKNLKLTSRKLSSKSKSPLPKSPEINLLQLIQNNKFKLAVLVSYLYNTKILKTLKDNKEAKVSNIPATLCQLNPE